MGKRSSGQVRSGAAVRILAAEDLFELGRFSLNLRKPIIAGIANFVAALSGALVLPRAAR